MLCGNDRFKIRKHTHNNSNFYINDRGEESWLFKLTCEPYQPICGDLFSEIDDSVLASQF